MKTFKSISQKLVNQKIPFEEITFLDEAVSARTADSSVGKNYQSDNAIKTLIITTKSGYKALILQGKDRIDEKKLEKIVGKWSIIGGDKLKNEFDFLPGCVCPFILDLPFLIDKGVLSLDVWSMGAGDKKKGINVATETAIKNITNKQIVSIK